MTYFLHFLNCEIPHERKTARDICSKLVVCLWCAGSIMSIIFNIDCCLSLCFKRVIQRYVLLRLSCLWELLILSFNGVILATIAPGTINLNFNRYLEIVYIVELELGSRLLKCFVNYFLKPVTRLKWLIRQWISSDLISLYTSQILKIVCRKWDLCFRCPFLTLPIALISREYL